MPKTAKRNLVKVGEGEPVTRLRMQYSSKDMALAAAKAELDKRQRSKVTLSVTLPGRTDLQAEAPLTLAGFRDGVNGEWVITRVEHSLDHGGYACSVEAEAPNSNGQKKVTEAVE